MIGKLKAYLSDKLRNQIINDALLKYIPYQWYADSFAFGEGSNFENSGEVDGIPVPPNHLWIGYSDTPEGWVASGKEHLDAVVDIATQHGWKADAEQAILDFGCGPGRMTRHWPGIAPQATVWGVDIHSESIVS